MALSQGSEFFEKILFLGLFDPTVWQNEDVEMSAGVTNTLDVGSRSVLPVQDKMFLTLATVLKGRPWALSLYISLKFTDLVPGAMRITKKGQP